MNIRSSGLLGAGVLALSLYAGGACAADYAVLHLHTDVDQPADAVWKKVGGYCDIAAWLKVTCDLTSGSGDVGTVRHLTIRGNSVDEVLVAKTEHSYTYTQPNTTILYHGTLAVVPNGKGHSRLLYTLIWDQSAEAGEDARAKDRDGRARTFDNALASMKAIAEAK
ncbi:MAG TPA: SRPBCC family protein [Steroidobacteraceae bacterium]|nr:SRPBCC family protein [Steroidobacteraceae bacterium]